MSDTSLVFNLVARDRASAALGTMKEKIATAAAGISAAVAGALGKGVADSLDMSAASSKLAAQLGIGPEKSAELAKISASVYADAWGESAEEVNTAIKGVIQNMGDLGGAKGIKEATVKAEALAKTFDVDVSESTAAAGQLMRTGLAKDATEAFDIITAGMQTGVDKSGDLIDTVGEYSTQFRQLGLDGATATGILAQGLRAGARDADVVADSLKEFTLIAQSGSQASKDAFKELGLSGKEMQRVFVDGGPKAAAAFDTVMDRLRAMKDPVERNNTALALFGTKSEDVQKALLALDPSSAKAALGDVAGAADRMAKTVHDNPSAALEQFKRDAQMKLAEVGGKFVQFAMDNKTYMEPLGIALAGIAGTILLVQGVTMAWAAVQNVVKGATMAWTAAQWLWNVAMNANPIGLIIIGVAALVAGFILLYQKSDTFRAICTTAFNAVWGAIKFVWDWVKGNWPLLLGILTGPVGMAVWAITHYWDNIKSGASSVWNWIKTVARGIGDAFANVGSMIWAPFKWAFNMVAWGWNNSVAGIGFTVPDWVPGVGGRSFHVPRIPALAQGGHITGAGSVLVGEAGPEILSLGAGATVTPLSKAGGGFVRVQIDLTGADSELKQRIRKMVRVEGGGNVQVMFGQGS
ncbi:phage-related minor tail protein [Streptomyces sp. TLI_235]|nr:phage tail tape measure protein [Streptomyces sp. TLI_235]PBC79894.1 phage-related minor tail protein [Streptomyces sp. TLI_235]